VVCGRTSVTYGELADASARLADRLTAAGAGPDVLVAVRLERGPAAVAAVLGVLRAGAAYLPIDPGLPARRGELLVRTAGARLLVGDGETWREPVVLDTATGDPARRVGHGRPVPASPGDLAYLLFTSGSTGTPKGVATERRALDHLVEWYLTRSRSAVDGPVLQFSALSWDTSTAEIFPTLCAGGCVVVATEDQRHDPDALLSLLCDEYVARVLLPPQMLSLLAETCLRRGRFPECLVDVAAGGERLVLSPTLRRWLAALDGCTLQNHYGPTETQLVTAYRAEDPATAPDVVPIGGPCGSTRLYVLDADLRPVQVGVHGELYIAGLGLARGYLGQPGATAARFLPDPFGSPGGRMYRSGDVVCWQPDGNLRFVGRTDDQVKVRGHRVELGEVQAAIEALPGVRRAAVAAVPDGRGSNAAEAFVEPAGPVDAAALRARLEQTLPGYLLPRRIDVVERIRLNANGKADIAALVAARPAQVSTERPDDAESPGAQDVVATLARCFADVLGQQVQPDTDFFELGGDSMAAVHIANACRVRGLHVTPRGVLTTRTVTALAATVRTVGSGAAQTPATGAFPLSPAQAAMLTADLGHHDHWNQAALFEVAPGLDRGALRAAVHLLLAAHGSLRLRFELSGDGAVRQRVGAAPASDPVWTVDLSHCGEVELAARLRRFAETAHRSLDVVAGALLRIVYADLGPNRPGRLLVVVHQLAFDMFSWPILTDDLQRLYRELVAGPGGTDCAEVTPYSVWVDMLARHALAAETEAEVPYWLAAAADPGSVPLDHDVADPVAANVADTGAVVETALGAEETAALLRHVPRVLRSGIGEAVLWALGESVAAWSDRDTVRIDVLGHGREEDIADLDQPVDLSRTTGWFTSVTPLRVTRGGGHAADRLAAVRDQWRAVPRGGIGYGASRAFGRAPLVGQLARLPDAHVGFDFVGRAELARPDGLIVGQVPADLGSFVHPRWRRPHLVEVQGAVEGGRLRLTWVYSTALHERASIEAAARRQRDALRQLLAA
jgi:amino acid adenylation domain-containing protein/non-ribosomal peptide synthase protein (TIGR01720 family)